VIDICLPAGEELGSDIVKELQEKYPDVYIKPREFNPLEQDDLRQIHPEEYDNVILLNRIEEDTEKIDSTTITTLLLLKNAFREYSEETGKEVKTQIISEVMNSDNLELVVRTGVNDSIISYQMISKLLAQVAENPEILLVYEDLFSEEGSEIYLKPIDIYLEKIPEKVTVADLMLLASKRKEILIGYRSKVLENSVQDNFGISINMPKNKVIEPQADDSLIVLSEDEL
jgi:hypothetical protein